MDQNRANETQSSQGQNTSSRSTPSTGAASTVKSGLHGKGFDEQVAVLTPREPARARGVFRSAPPVDAIEVVLNEGALIERLGLEIALGPSDADPGAVAGLAQRAIAAFEAADKPRGWSCWESFFSRTPLPVRLATVVSALSNPNHGLITRFIAEAAHGVADPDLVSSLPVATQVTDAALMPIAHLAAEQSFDSNTHRDSTNGFSGLTVRMRAVGFSLESLEAQSNGSAGDGFSALRPSQGQAAHRLGSHIIELASRADTQAELEPLLLPEVQAFIQADCEHPETALEIDLTSVRWSAGRLKLAPISGAGGQVSAHEGGVTLGGDGASARDQGPVNLALLIDNSAVAGEGAPGPSPTRARDAASELAASGFDIERLTDVGATAIGQGLAAAMAQVVQGDRLHVVFSGHPGPSRATALTPAGRPLPLGLFAEIERQGAARGVMVQVDIDVASATLAGEAQADRDAIATHDLHPLALPRVELRAEDPPEITALVALAQEMRTLLALLQAQPTGDALKSRFLKRLPPTEGQQIGGQLQKVRDELLALKPSLPRDGDLAHEYAGVLAAIAAERARAASPEDAPEQSMIISATAHDELAADDASYTQAFLAREQHDKDGTHDAALATRQHGKTQNAQIATALEDGSERTRRKALVIGNGEGYLAGQQLSGAARDARDMAAKWRSDGYEVEHHEDMVLDSMRAEIAELCAGAGPGDDLAFYYSGHGTALGLVCIFGGELDYLWIAAQVGRARKSGAKVTVIVDACQAGDLASLGGGALVGDDHLPELEAAPDDPPHVRALVYESKRLRDLYLANGTPQAVRESLWADRARALAPFAVALPIELGKVSAPQLALAFRQLEQRLAQMRADAKKAAWLQHGV